MVERIFEGRKASAGLMLLSSPLMCIPHYANHHHILCCLASAPVQQSVSDLAPPLLSPPEQIDFCVWRDFLPCWWLSSSPLSTCNPTLRCPSRLLHPRVTVHLCGPRSSQLRRVSASARRAMPTSSSGTRSPAASCRVNRRLDAADRAALRASNV